MPHLRRWPLVLVERREVGRDGTRLRVRHLMGEGQGRATTWELPAGETVAVHDGELALHHGGAHGLLPVWPWLVWEEDRVWLLDRLGPGRATYKTPGGGTLDRDAAAVWRHLGVVGRG